MFVNKNHLNFVRVLKSRFSPLENFNNFNNRLVYSCGTVQMSPSNVPISLAKGSGIFWLGHFIEKNGASSKVKLNNLS